MVVNCRFERMMLSNLNARSAKRLGLVLVFPLLLLVAISAVADERVERDEVFKKSYKKGKNYFGFCMFCHASNGKGTVLDQGGTMAPPLAGSPRVLGDKEALARIIMHGLTGPVDGKIYEKNDVAMMPPPPMMLEDDEIIAGILTYIRNSWGNEASEVTVPEVKRIRKAAETRKKPWTIEELAKTFPSKAAHGKRGGDDKKVAPKAKKPTK
jgi:mono/diheme cytochrome c family protein